MTDLNTTATLLYVEDNDDNIYMLSRRLQRRNFVVHEARTGQEGIEAAVRLVPDLVIMDLVLPDRDGRDITRELKQLPKTRDIPVLALSANASVVDRESALAAGCDDFDTKPVDFDRLLGKIQELLRESE